MRGTRSARLLAAAIATTATLSACDSSWLGGAPFTATLGNLRLSVPDRPDLYQAKLSGGTVIVRVCHHNGFRGSDDLPATLCEGLSSPVVGQGGVHTFISSLPVIEYDLLTERPVITGAPNAAPLRDIPEDRINRQLGQGTEAYALSRVGFLVGDELQTTDHGWPVAACKTHHRGGRYCVIGFLIEDAFVEARWFADEGVELNQAELWEVASHLDTKLRGLIVEPQSRSNGWSRLCFDGPWLCRSAN